MTATISTIMLAAVLAGGIASGAARAEDLRLGGDGDPGQPRSCIEVEIDGQKASEMSCLDQELEHETAKAPKGAPAAPYSAGSPAVRTGGFNQTAIRQQYGQNLGKSAQPYRPAAPVFAPPLGGH